jgi:hypothetical protein
MGIRAKVAADGCLDALLGDELGGLDAGAPRGIHSRIGMRLPFHRVGIDNQEIGPAPEASIDIRFNVWRSSCQDNFHGLAQQILEFILVLDFFSEDVDNKVISNWVFAVRLLGQPVIAIDGTVLGLDHGPDNRLEVLLIGR